MKASIQTKLLFICVLIVLLAISGISVTYYLMSKQDKHRESQQRIQIAFEIMLDDFANRITRYKETFEDFLKKEDVTLGWTLFEYNENEAQISSTTFIISYTLGVAEKFKNFGDVVLVDRLALYGLNKRLLVSYQNDAGRRTVGLYAKSRTGNDTYLSIDPTQSISVVLLADKSIPDNPVPASIITTYEGEIPETLQAHPFRRGRQFGIRVIAPVYRKDTLAGVLVGEIVYTQSIMDRYASLSKTAVNLFAGDQFSIGTLAAQTSLSPHVGEQTVRCADVLQHIVKVFKVS